MPLSFPQGSAPAFIDLSVVVAPRAVGAEMDLQKMAIRLSREICAHSVAYGYEDAKTPAIIATKRNTIVMQQPQKRSGLIESDCFVLKHALFGERRTLLLWRAVQRPAIPLSIIIVIASAR